ncbi:MAG TPA: hypothetical protein VFH17_08570 [Coriobacteriia bacterium]|nr:hypothetical protein [Coriobacteriia bacterium]
MPEIKVTFDDEQAALLRLAAGGEKLAPYIRRAALADAGRHKKRLAKTAEDVLTPVVERIIARILQTGRPIWGNTAEGHEIEAATLDPAAKA